ncbi:MAG: S1 RNA-binding domain-containing protein, partial [Spirochaetes bacterium]|nr:S1 RNA-binding domain-containing protein [Spirochaetota bacterium]
VNGRVVHFIKNGTFIEIEDGLEGFLPVNRMSFVKKIHKPEEILHLNDIVQVKILEIKKSEKRILLELVTNEPDPWHAIEHSFIHTIHSGIIESSRSNGVVVRLENGMEGFIPKSELLKDRGDIPSLYPTGSPIKVAIKECRPEERKLVLSEKGAIALQESQEFHMYQKEHSHNSNATTLGTLFKERFSEIQNKIKSNQNQ